MWKDSMRNNVVIFQPNILRIVGFYVRHSAYDITKDIQNQSFKVSYFKPRFLRHDRGLA